MLHLAAESHLDRSIEAPADLVQSNVVGTTVLLSEAQRRWDIRCEEAGERLRSRARITVVIFISQCDGPLRKTTKVVAYYRRVDWPRWRLVDDSVRADIISDAKSIEGALVGHR